MSFLGRKLTGRFQGEVGIIAKKLAPGPPGCPLAAHAPQAVSP